jgi:hypothetical protein
MPVNNIQKIIILDISANTKALIDAKLLEGYVIIQIVSLAPTLAKILIVYTTPDIIG